MESSWHRGLIWTTVVCSADRSLIRFRKCIFEICHLVEHAPERLHKPVQSDASVTLTQPLPMSIVSVLVSASVTVSLSLSLSLSLTVSVTVTHSFGHCLPSILRPQTAAMLHYHIQHSLFLIQSIYDSLCLCLPHSFSECGTGSVAQAV